MNRLGLIWSNAVRRGARYSARSRLHLQFQNDPFLMSSGSSALTHSKPLSKLDVCSGSDSPTGAVSSLNGPTSGNNLSNLSLGIRSHTCGELGRKHIGMEVSLCGWVHNIRLSRFLMVRDVYGVVQVYLPKSLLQKSHLDLPVTESVVKISGTVQARPAKDVNPDLSTGEIEVLASSLQVLSAASPEIPFTQKDKTPTNETLRLAHRYLDLRSVRMQRNLRFRSDLILQMRQFLCNTFQFVEIETPYLFKRTPGGAKEFITPTRFPGHFYSLPQSPQQFKQLLMVGGVDRYMQIARCFRDEPSRSDRQPEFTQLDLEMCFVTADDVFHVVEQLLSSVWPLVQLESENPPDLIFPFPRMDYSFAISRYGTDKPDIRFDFGFCDTTPEGLLGFKVPSTYARELSAENWTKLHRKISEIANVPVSYFEVDHPPDGTHQLLEAVKAEPADTVVFVRGCGSEEKKALGLARTELASMLHEKGLPIYKPGIHFLWVQNFPLFERDETGKLVSVHHPFTAPTEDTLPSLYSDPEKVVGQHYDLVCNGQEIGGGSIRIHDASLQRYILSAILREETADMEYFITALKFGAPPHGGIALGLDRLISIFLGTKSIRDVIAFPKSADGKDLMCGAPTKARKEDLDYYGISVTDSV